MKESQGDRGLHLDKRMGDTREASRGKGARHREGRRVPGRRRRASKENLPTRRKHERMSGR